MKFFGDLYDNEAALVSRKLGQGAGALLRNALGKDSSKSTEELILQSKTYPIRSYTDQLPKEYRERTIKALREALSYKGVTGKWCTNDELIKRLLPSHTADCTIFCVSRQTSCSYLVSRL